MPKPPDSRIIPLDRQDPLTHAQIEQVRFGLGDTGPLAQAVMNANVPALAKQLAIGAVSCLSTRRPSDPVVGQMVYETDTQRTMFWNGSAWINPVAFFAPDACDVFNASFSLANATSTTVTFTSQTFVNNGIHSLTTNPTRVTIANAGIYLVIANSTFGLSINGRRLTTITMTGTGGYSIQTNTTPIATTGEASGAISGLFYAPAGNYFTLGLYQNSGGALTCDARLSVSMIGQKA
jgi:hypothetical protein